MNYLTPPPEAPAQDELEEGHPSSISIVPLPSAGNMTPLRQTTPLTPLIADPRAVARLLEALLQKGGLTTRAASARLGTSDQSLRQYLKGRRSKPSLYWFIKFVEACGGRVLVELPGGDRRF